MKLERVQIVRKSVLVGAIVIGIAIFTVTGSRAPSGSTTHEMIEWIGIVAIVVCIVGRSWSSMYIGGRKVAELVTEGPYSVTRNPLYLFSILGAAGVGAQTGSVVAGLAFGALAWAVFYLVALQEERVMAARHPAEFSTYAASVPRFWPTLALWHDVATLTVRPANVVRTFGDALIMLLAIPLAETFDALQETGALPILFRLP